MMIPLKQGLKPESQAHYASFQLRLNDDSIKTRIETPCFPCFPTEAVESE